MSERESGLALTIVRGIGVAAVAALAAGLVFESGRRGFFAVDQSILFDGGYRIAIGQVPYRDFFIPNGPVSLSLQALFFKLFGIDYGTYILHAAVVNAAAALLAFLWVRRLFPEARLHAYLAAVLTAFWFYPPFGTPWFEQTAFFFHFISMAFLVAAWRRPAVDGRGYLLLVAAGMAGGLSFLSKQNAGLLAVAASLGVILLGFTEGARRKSSSLTAFLSGVALTFAVFAVWLTLTSDVHLFRLFFFEIPSEEGWRRLGQRTPVDLLLGAFSMANPVRTASSLAAVVASSAFLADTYQRFTRREGFLDARRRLAATTLLSLFVVQNLFIRLTVNQPENGFSLSGMIVVLGMLLVRDLPQSPSGSPRPSRSLPFETAYWLGSLVMCLALVQQARHVALTRSVHDLLWRSRFEDSVVSRSMYPVQWAIPTPAARRSEEQIQVGDLDQLVEFLKASDGDFFVFPDFTVLYGLTGRTPPQPLLWFHQGLTYPRDPTPWLDRLLVQSLHERRVEYVVLESVSLRGTDKQLAHFPALDRYLRGGFEPVREFGIFRVLRRRGEPPETP
jgi:hypothetical protein